MGTTPCPNRSGLVIDRTPAHSRIPTSLRRHVERLLAEVRKRNRTSGCRAEQPHDSRFVRLRVGPGEIVGTRRQAGHPGPSLEEVAEGSSSRKRGRTAEAGPSATPRNEVSSPRVADGDLADRAGSARSRRTLRLTRAGHHEGADRFARVACQELAGRRTAGRRRRRGHPRDIAHLGHQVSARGCRRDT